MNYEMIIVTMLIAFILILFIIKLITPHIVRRELFFGVRLPENLLNDERLLDFKKAYMKNYLFVCGFYTISFCIILAQIPSNTVLFTGLTILILLSTWLYFVVHQRVLEFKQANEDDKKDYKKQLVVIDMKFRNDKICRVLPSSLWFTIPLAIIGINIAAGYLVYDELPIIISTHWNAQGEVDGGVFKTWGLIYLFPVLQMFITALMVLLFCSVGWSKVQINAANPVESRERNRIFRYRWGVNIISLNIIILLGMSILNFFILQIIPVNMPVLLLTQPMLIGIVLMDILIMAIWTGQGGSRIMLEPGNSSGDNAGIFDDDKYWLGGLVYYNPSDPSLFVEKRFGIAWGLNYGNIRAYILLGTLIGTYFMLVYIIELLIFY